jgi:hypothetical protein
MHGEEAAWQASGFEPEEERRARAKLLVIHQTVQALWNASAPIRTTELTRVNGTELFLGLVRRILRECDLLILLGRRWDFRWRREAATAPLGGLVTTLLRLKGIPMTAEELADLLAPYRQQPTAELVEKIASFLRTRLGQTSFITSDGRFGLMEWLPQVEGLEVAEAKEAEFWQRTEFADWLIAQTPDEADALRAAIGLLDAAAMPLTYREVLFALWAKGKGQRELIPLLEELLRLSSLRWLAMGYCVTEAGWARALQLLAEQSQALQASAQQRVRHLDLDRLLQSPPSPKEPSVHLSQEDADELAAWLKEQPVPVPLERLVEQVLEVLPLDPDFVPTLRAVAHLLRSDGRFAELGSHCWWLAEKRPEGVEELPPVLVPPPPPPLPATLEGQFDLVLPKDAIDEDLRQFVEDPTYEEVGEEEDAVMPTALKPTRRLDIPVLYPHLTAGTLKVRRIDCPFFPEEPALQFLLATDESGREVPLWVNLSLGLCFGLKEWYERQGVTVGGLVRLERAKSGQVSLRWTHRHDRWLSIPLARLDELRRFAAHETVRQAPLIVLLQSLMAQHPQGVHFLRLWSELNVLRRTTKRMLASLLCAYPMFARIPNQAGFWTMDFNKIGEGVREEKRRWLTAQGEPSTV